MYSQEVRALQAQVARQHQARQQQPTQQQTDQQAAAPKPAVALVWQGFRKFRVLRKHRECDGCHSFYLVPDDGQPLPPFVPGQFLTISLSVPNEPKPVVRCYSLSAAPRPDYYRCTIKRALPPGSEPSAPPGKASNYFNEVVSDGDFLDVKPPHGSFQLNTSSQRSVVLITAGVGITPLFSMLQWLAATKSDR